MEIAVEHNDVAAFEHFDALVARCRADSAAHMTGGTCSEQELRNVEEILRRPLPAVFRSFLARQGGGVFYLRHEIFGAHRVMTHDIELVPDLLSFRAWLGAAVPANVLPIHRADGRIHALDLDAGCVHPLGAASPCYPTFSEFLERVVLP